MSLLPAFVLGIEHPRSVSAIRSLARKGIPVIGVNYDVGFCEFSSRYLVRRHIVRRNQEDSIAFFDSIRNGGGVLIPTDDDFLIFVSRNFDHLSNSFVLTVPPWHILEPLMNKSKSYSMARESGLKTPHFFKPGDSKDLDDVLSVLDFANHEYLLKTMPGTLPADIKTGRFTKVAGNDAQSLRNDCVEIFSRLGEYPLIEEVIPGEAGHCIGVTLVINRQQEPVLSYVVQRLKLFTYTRGGKFVHPYELGANVYCESIYDEEAVNASIRFLKRMNYFGVVTLEFRRNPIDGSLIYIKADPRVVRSNAISTALKMDVPTTLYQVFTGSADPKRTYRQGVGWIWFSQYLVTFVENRFDPMARQQLLALLKRFYRLRAFAFLDFLDPVPFLKDYWGRRLLRKFTKKIRRTSQKLTRIGSWSRVRGT